MAEAEASPALDFPTLSKAKAWLTQQGIDVSDCFERSELFARYAEVKGRIHALREQRLRAKANRAVQRKSYALAVRLYTDALGVPACRALRAVLHANRSTAYSNLGLCRAALDDGERAVELDPSYVKGYFRLGCARRAPSTSSPRTSPRTLPRRSRARWLAALCAHACIHRPRVPAQPSSTARAPAHAAAGDAGRAGPLSSRSASSTERSARLGAARLWSRSRARRSRSRSRRRSPPSGRSAAQRAPRERRAA